MKHKYRKGSSFERELKKLLEEEGFAVVRSAGSKGVDIIAGKDGKILIFECKSSSKSKFYVNREDIEKLITFSKIFGGTPYLAVKLDGEVLFVDPNLLSKRGKHYPISKEIKVISLSFYEIVGKGKQLRIEEICETKKDEI